MAHAVPARLSGPEGRRFGLTVGGAFLAIGAILWWRDRAAAPYLSGVGALLAVAGLLIPARLGPVQHAWTSLGHGIGKITSPLVMGLIYFGLLTPIGLLRRLLGRDELARRADASSYWVDRPEGARRSDMERQF